MVRFILARLVKAVFILLAILVLNFTLIHAAPGDPAAVMAGEAGASDDKFLEDLRARFGLDQPFHVQLWIYIKGAVQLDLGYSYRRGMPVAELIWDRLPATLLLTATAFFISIIFGVIAGVAAAARQGRWGDSIISTLALLFYATPLFWVALMASLLFSVVLGWLPGFGYETVGANYTGLARALDIGQHLILPATTLGMFFTAIYVRMTRASMLEVSRLDFVKTARAKGLSHGVIQRRHILRNALLPVITLAGLQAGQIVGGAVLTETVFAWPGIGRLLVQAIMARDIPVVQGTILVIVLWFLVINTAVDLLYAAIDPRIKQG